ncbi:MAG: carboxypeptidase-like regulatory domain-containing protein [Pyrinomonadaceae bacterium MAG19_C2-C3]|nr:carboxypeptidase-like regulatory domain-containing protein [Pyrinomonadaceae bacterium MAG19_C2-C3]
MTSLTKVLLLAVLTLTLSVTPILAQASSSTAELRGTITDSGGAVVPNATVTLTDTEKGTARTAQSDEEGRYVFLVVPPSDYELKVESANFAASNVRVSLTVGQQAEIPVQLSAGGLEATVDIVAGAEVVDTDRTQQSSVISERQITNLPIGRRNYLDYALLTPGVTDSDNIADASDFRVAQTPQSGLSFGGNNGRGNYIAVDGAAINDASGGVIQTISQEGVQEFQVLRNSYSAEFGNASGGVINTISKTGSNRISGSLFGLFRDDKFDARNPFDFAPDGQSPFSRQQYGGSLGFPIRQDKTFGFVTLERFNQNQTTFVNLLNDPAIFNVTASQNALFTFLQAGTPFAAAATGLRGALTTTATAFPRTVNLFNDASGQFPFKENQTLFSTRFDNNFSSRHNAYARFSLTDQIAENQAAGALTAVSRGRTIDAFNGSVLLSDTFQFNANTVNEFKGQFLYNRFGVIPNDAIGPEFNIEGFGNFGRDIFLPSNSIERHYDFYDNVTRVAGNHTFKFGGTTSIQDVSTDSETFFGGRFNFGAAIPLANIIALNPALGPTVLANLRAFLSPQTATNPNGVNRPDLLAALNTPINALQAFNLGLPIVYQQGFGETSAKSVAVRTGFYAQDTWKARRNLTLTYGLRYAINDEAFFIPTDKNDFQPRFGFSYDPFSDGKTVIRGGAGIFSGNVINVVANVTTELSARGNPSDIDIVLATATSNAFGLPSSFAVYQTLQALTGNFSRQITEADVFAVAPPTAGVLPGLTPTRIVPRPGSPLDVRFREDPNYKTPTTYQASLGLQRDLGAGFSLDLGYLFTRGLYLTRNRDLNPFRQTGAPNPLNPNGGPTFVRVRPTATGIDSDFRVFTRLQDNQYESSANSFYHAGTFALTRRFANNFSLNTHYTYSKSIDEVTDFNSDFSAQNPLNLRADRALSAFDQRHRAVFSGVFQSSSRNRFLRDFILSPIFIAGSGRPFNLLLGFDSNGDGRSQSDRPGTVGRNTGLGEPFYSLDMRLARRFAFGENRFLELTAEGFNLLNRTNFAGVNNIVGALPLADREALITSTNTTRGDRTVAPTRPLGFTSAAAARTFQFGARFNF